MHDELRALMPEERPIWDAYVNRHPAAGPYHRTAWLEAVRRAYGFSSVPLSLWRKGALVGVMPLVRHAVPGRNPVFTSLPFCDFGDALADSLELVVKLRAHALELARGAGCALELRRPVDNREEGTHGVAALDEDEQTAHGAETDPQKVLMRLPLATTSEVLWQSFRSKLRNQVNRPVKKGMACRIGGAELIEPFYGIYARNMRDLGSPPHARTWFEEVAAGYGDDARVFVVYQASGLPVAASVLLLNGTSATVPWSSSLREWNAQCPNMLLYWSMLEYAAQNGYGLFDFGRSTPGEGTYRFKAQWGAEPVALRWERHSPDGSMDVATGSGKGSASRRWAVACWQRLPVAVSTLAGSVLRRYISL
ncbi:GNAT family N-acetyltransferase [Desulfovibrio mangrovi]|uniref:GNAT family N-acetyltransferase n=1 Tax=Desulfovibrio mangrovi TaxID=2976983 RepID=UPI002247AB04|nr:GNAT family N-acetyltransferase [Desulfovibrio mangrovi]UZP67554.1 GNAT family N-acetyltransferase [Desulfovibrio mangrovi]